MLNDANASRFKKVYLATGFTDLRRGIDGLANATRFIFKKFVKIKSTLLVMGIMKKVRYRFLSVSLL